MLSRALVLFHSADPLFVFLSLLHSLLTGFSSWSRVLARRAAKTSRTLPTAPRADPVIVQTHHDLAAKSDVPRIA